MNSDRAYANALATAFASDLMSPEVARVIQSGGLTRNQFTRIVNRDVIRGFTGESGPALFPAVRAFARQVVDIGALKRARAAGMSGLGAGELAGAMSLGGAIVGAVGAIWGASITANNNRTLARIALQQQQIAMNAEAIAARSALIQNATAQGLRANADGQVIDPSTGEPLPPGGFPDSAAPTVGVAAGILAALAAGGYYLTHR